MTTLVEVVAAVAIGEAAAAAFRLVSRTRARPFAENKKRDVG